MDSKERGGQAHEDEQTHREDFREVAREQEMHAFTHVCVDCPPFQDRLLDGREIVVREDHVRALAGDIRPVFAHGDADVRGFEGRGVVHPIPRHGHDVAVCLQGFHDVDFVAWAHAGEDGNAFDEGGLLIESQGGEILPRHDLAFLFRDPKVPRDREGGVRVVARDHDRADARAP